MLKFAEDEAKGASFTPAPEAVFYLWEWFEEIKQFSSARNDRLLPSELVHWAALRGIDLEPFEATTLLHMDVVYRAYLPRKQ